jgi:ssDNA-specific exonuclease RecJ
MKKCGDNALEIVYKLKDSLVYGDYEELKEWWKDEK